jgi:hypothetical protein
MSGPLFDLALRRERIRARIAEQRHELEVALSPFAPAISMVDAGLGVWRYLRAHPQWLLGGAVALLVWRPRGSLKWARRIWVLGRTWRQFRDWTVRS